VLFRPNRSHPWGGPAAAVHALASCERCVCLREQKDLSSKEKDWCPDDKDNERPRQKSAQASNTTMAPKALHAPVRPAMDDHHNGLPVQEDTTEQPTMAMAGTARRRKRGVRSQRYFAAFLSQQCLFVLMLRIWVVSSQQGGDGGPGAGPGNDPSTTVVPTQSPAAVSVSTLAPIKFIGTALPTISPKPILQPTNSPQPTTDTPSLVPTVSPEPSIQPSQHPSLIPTLSLMPSPGPSVSSHPTISKEPTEPPTNSPSLTYSPLSPSSFPSTTPPTSVPTPQLDVEDPATENFLFVKLSNVPRNVTFAQFTDKYNTTENPNPLWVVWRRLTTTHMQDYWRSFGEQSPYYIGRTVTQFIREDWGEVTESNTIASTSRRERNLQSNATLVGTLTITYSQECALLRREGAVDPYPGFKESDLFTLPFQQYRKPYTESIANLFNSTGYGFGGPFILLQDSGVARDPAKRDPEEKNLIAATVSVVTIVLLAASAYIVYLTKFKHRSSDSTTLEGMEGDSSPIVGAVIGVNPNENILISESYDEEYVDAKGDIFSPNKSPHDDSDPSSDGKKALSVTDENARVGSDDGDNPPVRDLTTEGDAFVTLSNANISEAEAGGMLRDNDHAHGALSSYRSTASGSQQFTYDPDNMSPLGSSPATRRTPQHGSGSDTGEEMIEFEDESEEPSVPFMGFQMEIQDLE